MHHSKLYSEGRGLYLSDKAVQKVEMKMSILEAEDRVWSLQQDYMIEFQAARLESLPASKQHVVITPIMSLLKPQHLKCGMKNIKLWWKDKDFKKRI